MAVVLVTLGLFGGCSTFETPEQQERLAQQADGFLRQALTMERPIDRVQGIEACAEVLPADEAAALVTPALQDNHPAVRFAACMALGRLQRTETLPAVRALADDPDPRVQIGAYFAMERMNDSTYRRRWADALLNSKNVEVRRNAAMALGQLEDPEVAPLLLKAGSADDDDGVRLQAWESLVYLGNKDAVDRFVHDAFGSVGHRQPFALLALGHVEDDRVVPALRSRLAIAPYPESRLAAARSLGMQGHAEGYDLAAAWLNWNRPDPRIIDDPPANQIARMRLMAAMALGDIGDLRALPLLERKMVGDDSDSVRLAAARSILLILNKNRAVSMPQTD